MPSTEKTTVTKLKEEDLDWLATRTECSRDELQARFDVFIKNHPDGGVTKKDFRSLMETCFPKRYKKALEKRIFCLFDENRDGSITFKELMVVVYIMSKGTPEERLKQIFRMLDVNGDGFISRKEMKKVVGEIYQVLLSQDDDANEEDMDKKTLVENAFMEMDLDHDGKVSEEEFVGAVMAQEKGSSILALKIMKVFKRNQI